MREGKPLDSNHTKPTSTGQCLRTRANVPRLLTEKTAKTFHNMKPLPHNTQPVYEKLALTNALNAMTNYDGTDISTVPRDKYFHGPMMQTLERQLKGKISLFVRAIHRNVNL